MKASALSQYSLHKQVFQLAIPMVISNITIPLLGLVDAAVIGHLDKAWYLGGVALGNTIISVIFFLLGFLRMATTGLNAQAFGANNKQQQANILVQGILISTLLALLLLATQSFLAQLIFTYSGAGTEVKFYGEQYFHIRIFAAPAALANLVIIGWLLGNQNARGPMWLLICNNLINIILDIYFVLVLDWKVAGAATASMISDYLACMLGFYFVIQQWRHLRLPALKHILPHIRQDLTRILRLNRDIFLRSLCLEAVYAYMTFYSASLGDTLVAANAILLSMLLLISYGMDGFAFAMEALVGKNIGEKNLPHLRDTLVVTTFWGATLSVLLTLFFFFGGKPFILMITSLPEVQLEAERFLPWLILFPLSAMWCFLLDGIFIGATRAREMRNTMLLAFIAFFSTWYLLQETGYHALWAAMLVFMLTRAASLGYIFQKLWQQGRFIPSQH